jgi:hypothetical protein
MRHAALLLLASAAQAADPRLVGSSRQPDNNGWIQVRLAGAPKDIGYQHGHHLAPEIADAQQVIRLVLTHDTHKTYDFFRDAARQVYWPKIEREYRDELEGIVEGLASRGVRLDLWDVLVLNLWNELIPYYTGWWDAKHKPANKTTQGAPEHCSAFVATGSHTRDGRPVMGHNAWTGYAEGQRWNIVFDIHPTSGHAIFMDGYPGLIHSGDDFGFNSAGLMITETTISGFRGFDPDGIAEAVRARKAMQYASTIDDFIRIMREGNNGGYANHWLVADRKTNEIASVELGLRNVTVRRTRDGYFTGSNYIVSDKLGREETNFDTNDPSNSANARRVRWEQVMAANKGRIDVDRAKGFFADHYDTFDKRERPSERTLCGHIDLSPRGVKDWQPPFAPAGAVQNKVADAAMAERMSFLALMGHACGRDFKARAHLDSNKGFNHLRPHLRDLPAGKWTLFSAR